MSASRAADRLLRRWGPWREETADAITVAVPAIVDADLWRMAQGQLDCNRERARPCRDLDEVVERLGRTHDLLSLVRESRLTLQRVVGFAGQVAEAWMSGEAKAKLRTADRDVGSLLEQDA